MDVIGGARLIKKDTQLAQINKPIAVHSAAGANINTYIDWIIAELAKKDFGEVAIRFTVMRGQVVDVHKESIDSEHFPLKADKRN